jgi:uncharacterized membrane protein
MEALGPILILLSIPLIFRWVPPNRFFGLRIPATLKNESVWYDANARSGRLFFMLGVLMVTLEFVLPTSARIPVLRVIGTVGFTALIVINWRAANRMVRERTAGNR